ncbi:MAG: winged helix DNA-binding protein, partial [Arthrobacter sp.]|nr:winged helix DNA-binding protein [Arthrobacter sp.]
SSMTHRLDKLALRGLVERTQDPGNRTRVFVSLTEEGRQLFNLAIKGSSVVETDVLQDLSSPEMKELARMLEVVIARLDDIEA